MQKVKPNITIDDLEKIDIRVGKILKAEDVENSRKLVRMTVDFGDFKRNILSGMKPEREDIKELEGKQALFVVNLEPRKMAGEMSEGMIYDLGYNDGINPVLAVPEDEVPNGVQAG